MWWSMQRKHLFILKMKPFRIFEGQVFLILKPFLIINSTWAILYGPYSLYCKSLIKNLWAIIVKMQSRASISFKSFWATLKYPRVIIVDHVNNLSHTFWYLLYRPSYSKTSLCFNNKSFHVSFFVIFCLFWPFSTLSDYFNAFI